jgi:RNA polymerase sigma-70 factor (ECF subfamily)|tara:strand:- start:549 stop:1046 length:498 start_codon:yes stop_codon:yes gene_type:complete
MKGNQFNKILEEHQQRIYSLALYILRDKHEAEDITQDVFTRLWHNLAQVNMVKVSAWLSAVTRNACIDKLRKGKEFSQIEDQHQITRNHEEPAGNLQHQELSSWLTNAISCLKEPYSSLIMLCDVQQTSQSIAAQSLNLTTSQVKVYLHRARRQLKNILKEYTHE